MKRAILTLISGLWGGATLLTMTNGDSPDLILPACMGAALAGALTAPLFGKAHPLWALIAAILATTLGASLAGAYPGWPRDLPLGIAFGPLAVWAGITQTPLSLVVWLLGAVAMRLIGYSLK
jgi:hypothetical protein